jgi:hypothetical protein
VPAAAADECEDAVDGALLMTYVQRRPEVTLLMLHAAWLAGFGWRHVPWRTFTDEPPALDAHLLVFRLRGAVPAPPAPAAAATDASDPDSKEYGPDTRWVRAALAAANGDDHGQGCGFAAAVASAFPCVQLEIARGAEARREAAEEAAAWRPPSPG